MEIQPARPAVNVRVLPFDKMSNDEATTLRNIGNDTLHNIYFTPGVAPILVKPRNASVPQPHGPGRQTAFLTVNAPVNDKGLLNGEGQVVLNIAEILTSAATTGAWAPQAPSVAALMPGVNIFVGVVGCYDKLSHSGLRKRIGGGMCFADMVVRTLLLLGNFIPGLQHMATWLIFVQVGIKVGDQYVEYRFKASETPSEAQGRTILQAVQLSTLGYNGAVLPLNGLGMPIAAAAFGSGLPQNSGLTQRRPPPHG